MKIIFILLIVLNAFFSKAIAKNDTIQIDAILNQLQTEKNIKKKIELNFLATQFYSEQFKHYPKCYLYLKNIKQLISKVKEKEFVASSYMKMGNYFMIISDFPLAIENINKAILVVNGLNFNDKLLCYNKLGILYSDVMEERKAINSYKTGIKMLLNSNIRTGDNIEMFYNNIAISYMDFDKIDSAIYFHKACLKLRLVSNNPLDIGQTYNNIGSVFFVLSKYDSALYYFKKGLTFRILSKNAPKSSICESEINIAKALIGLNQFKQAEIILKKAYKNSFNFIHSSLGIRAVEQFMNLYSKNGQNKKALFYTKKYYALKDSMYSLSTREEVIRLNLSFQYTDKMQKDSILSIEKEKIAVLEKKKEMEIQNQKNRESKIILFSMIVIIIFMVGIIILAIRAYNNKKKVSETTLLQNFKLEKINKEITDSITYAKRIQSAILPQDKFIKEHLPNSFILYKPKDIVAGDFYWFDIVEDLIFIAAADCTGHGVPGALVSVVCHNALNRSLKEFSLTNPADILDKTREIVVAEFEKSDEDVKDGMDISLCVLNKKNLTLSWSGAHNPLWILRNQEIIEYKADKQPIGKFAYAKAFTNHEIQLLENDEIFISTDGFQDQFGGEKGKKFKASQMKEILVSNAEKSIFEKEKTLHLAFDIWKKDTEQIDDVCLIGIKV